MRYLILSWFLLGCLITHGQSTEHLKLLSDHLTQQPENPRTIQVNQFLDNCIYEHRCSQFAKGAIVEFGLIKGLVLSIDRKLRCGNLAKSQMLPVRINSRGKVKDHWKNYRVGAK